jgi:hypothetical protein
MKRIIESFQEIYWLVSSNVDKNIDNIISAHHQSWIIIGMFQTKKKVFGSVGYEEQKMLNIRLGNVGILI